jgi:hypothetical protein
LGDASAYGIKREYERSLSKLERFTKYRKWFIPLSHPSRSSDQPKN